MADLKITSRKAWGAAAPTKSMYTVPITSREYFFVHYLGEEQSKPDAVAQLKWVQRFHQRDNGWSDIGYNYAIDNNSGEIFEARGRDKVGAHCPGYNRNGIGVVVMIGVGEEVSEAAKRSLHDLHAHLSSQAKKTLKIRGHKDGKATSCPGDSLYAFVKAGLKIEESQLTQPTQTLTRPNGGAGQTGPGGGMSDGPLLHAHSMDEDHSACDHISHPDGRPPVLRRGSRGPWVRVLQKHLRIGQDGDFGPNTERAVALLQNHWHKVNPEIVVDGIAGPQVWRILGVAK